MFRPNWPNPNQHVSKQVGWWWISLTKKKKKSKTQPNPTYIIFIQLGHGLAKLNPWTSLGDKRDFICRFVCSKEGVCKRGKWVYLTCNPWNLN